MVETKIVTEEVIDNQLETTSQIYVFGSGECEQLGKSTQLLNSFVHNIWQASLTLSNFDLLDLGLEFGEDDIPEIKRARKIELFNNDGSCSADNFAV